MCYLYPDTHKALAMTSRSTLSKRLTSGTSMMSTYRISMKSMRKSLPILLTCRNTEQASKLSSTHEEKYCRGREKHSDIKLSLSLQHIPCMIYQKTFRAVPKMRTLKNKCKIVFFFLENGTVAGFELVQMGS